MAFKFFGFGGRRSSQSSAPLKEAPAPQPANHWKANCELVEEALFGNPDNKLFPGKCLAIRLEGKEVTQQPTSERANELLFQNLQRNEMYGYVYDEVTGWIYVNPFGRFDRLSYLMVNAVMAEFKNTAFAEVLLINCK